MTTKLFFLQQVNIQDKLSGQHDVMSHIFDYIILDLMDFGKDVLGAVGNITNVLAIQRRDKDNSAHKGKGIVYTKFSEATADKACVDVTKLYCIRILSIIMFASS